jgi:hypothetical protein
MYSSTTSYNNDYVSTVRTTDLSPARHTTVVTASPQRTVTSTVLANPVPIGLTHSTHDVDPFGDAIVSYGVDELGEPVRITSTGILHGHEIRTFTERVAPGEATTSSHVTTNYLNPYESQVATTTTTDVMSPSRYMKTTTYSPSRVAPVHHEFAPLEVPITNTTSTTTTRHIGSPYRHVTTYAAPLSPVHNTTVVTQSPARHVSTVTASNYNYSPIHNTTVVTQSPARHVSTVTASNYSPARNTTVVTQSPSRNITTTTNYATPASPVRETVVTNHFGDHISTSYDVQPTKETVITNPGFGNATSTYSHGGRTTTIVNDVDVKSRVEMMLEHTRARLGT